MEEKIIENDELIIANENIVKEELNYIDARLRGKLSFSPFIL